eukprot:gb/GECG01008411.1/.p1 GENE.gb/GECG01008411.1/~~gb/GECG01008411.1/.p1  ORF type:complete len:221 (+),score=33.20 gb/GECG01008411.1/:1-663(+)
MNFNRGSSSLSAATLLCVALYQLQCAQAFMFDVPASGKKCFSDMLDKDILVVANYEILGVPQDQPSRFMVVATDPDGVVEYSRTDLSKAKMAFTASKEGMHTLCFHNHGPEQRRCSLDFRTGAEANDYGEIARKEHLKPLELELRKLEDRAVEVFNEQKHMREREKEHRDTNESTNTRVMLFSFLSILVVLTLGAWQLIHLNNFFQKKNIVGKSKIFGIF